MYTRTYRTVYHVRARAYLPTLKGQYQSTGIAGYTSCITDKDVKYAFLYILMYGMYHGNFRD